MTSDGLYKEAKSLAVTLREINFNDDQNKQIQDFYSQMEKSQVSDLIKVITILTSERDKKNKDNKPDNSANIKAIREGLISKVQEKNTETIENTLKAIDSAASKLSDTSVKLTRDALFVGKVVGWVGGILAFFQVVLGAIQVYKIFNP